jgi:hypothetical protein
VAIRLNDKGGKGVGEEMKYIMIDEVFPVIFSDGMKHSDFKKMGNITSAGMVRILNDEINCFGKSVSLKLEPTKIDALIIKNML